MLTIFVFYCWRTGEGGSFPISVMSFWVKGPPSVLTAQASQSCPHLLLSVGGGAPHQVRKCDRTGCTQHCLSHPPTEITQPALPHSGMRAAGVALPSREAWRHPALDPEPRLILVFRTRKPTTPHI